MTKHRDDGGPAFPIQHDDRPGAYEAHPGMSLRDWFAGQALAGVLADHTLRGTAKSFAEKAYELADAMLAERAKA